MCYVASSSRCDRCVRRRAGGHSRAPATSHLSIRCGTWVSARATSRRRTTSRWASVRAWLLQRRPVRQRSHGHSAHSRPARLAASAPSVRSACRRCSHGIRLSTATGGCSGGCRSTPLQPSRSLRVSYLSGRGGRRSSWRSTRSSLRGASRAWRPSTKSRARLGGWGARARMRYASRAPRLYCQPPTRRGPTMSSDASAPASTATCTVCCESWKVTRRSRCPESICIRAGRGTGSRPL